MPSYVTGCFYTILYNWLFLCKYSQLSYTMSHEEDGRQIVLFDLKLDANHLAEKCKTTRYIGWYKNNQLYRMA
jgi:uncharacterized membrane protein (DUF106 family)